MKFVDETDKKEIELRNLELKLKEKKEEVCKVERIIDNDNTEEFELDEKEIALNEQLPAIDKQFNSLKASKSRLETETEMAHNKNKGLQEDLSTFQQDLEQWRIQIVRSPEKIAIMQEDAKNE
mmetsp:Transcript_6910/g.6066  ORF Transcript_6910/g.6066 Transcript_6910/m.6066 type:complete len:123 (+) Transcript_6910:344-712(+)|eukprot:CAMPEP_0205809936 /NCGR_PEP_ID=MMETSP0205-20121125/14149_1 /ASSEMBLY_ACC=CAM_ASM_000278 /TAXON_ID=36767 /ORGANISM="Euplotes focardii, Strain TN1" /LENGTH=122 /DNA_ID=CAMNT_0053087631 /DNA_START=270 /DNA_END=638 /DNA_ORIENTATION=+